MSAAANAEAFTQPHWRVIAAGWWLDFENLARIRRFAVDNGYRLRDAARLMLALPYAWTRVDLLLRALLTHPLRAFTGPGKPAQAPSGGADRSSRWIPTQHVAVRQLYIPGLFVRGHSPQLHSQVFVQPVEITRVD
jgi:hypothetical protein